MGVAIHFLERPNATSNSIHCTPKPARAPAASAPGEATQGAGVSACANVEGQFLGGGPARAISRKFPGNQQDFTFFCAPSTLGLGVCAVGVVCVGSGAEPQRFLLISVPVGPRFLSKSGNHCYLRDIFIVGINRELREELKSEAL